jgi:uncharacterized membrane protein YcaP (DUF421 family)
MDMFQLGIPPWEFVVRSITIDFVLLLALRIFGKREVGQFTLYDLVMILLVANAVQPAMTGQDYSLLGGLIIIGSLLLFNAALSWLDQFDWFHRLLVAPPRVLVRNGRYVTEAMRREGIDKDDVTMAMREHGVGDLKDVQLGVLESDGSISIVSKGSGRGRGRRLTRYVKHG